MADVTKSSYSEANLFTRVLFQRGKDVLDYELNELQDIVRIFMYRMMYASTQQAEVVTTYNPGSNDEGYLVVGDGASDVEVTEGTLFCDGIPVRLEATTRYTPTAYAGSPRTDVIYLTVQEAEVADPAQTSDLGETTRRTQLQATLHTSTTGLAGVPSNTVEEIWEGGVRHFPIAQIARTASNIAALDVTDLRKELPPSRLLTLITTLTGTGGGAYVGTAAVAASFSGALYSLIASTVQAQITKLLEYVNNEYRTVTVSGHYTIDATVRDTTLVVDTSAARNITLPPPSAGRRFWIVDKTGTAHTNNITLVRNGSEKIDGTAASRVLQKSFGRWYVVSDGTDWYVFTA